MTNKEKCFDKADPKQLAKWICQYGDNLCCICANSEICDDENKRRMAGGCEEGIERWLSQEAELTADEMFTELGYKKSQRALPSFSYVYDKNGGNYVSRIVIEKTSCGFYYIKHKILYTKYFFEEYARSETITEAEDKAIHQKFEEIKQFIKNLKK